MKHLLLFVIAAAWWMLGVGCASRSLPAEFPASSAASSVAPEARARATDFALREDPPLPGEPSEHWRLSQPNGAPAPAPPHDHQHGASEPQSSQAASPGVAEGSAVYVCPMHPGVVSNRPGTCPRCGMALVHRP